jgi:hypothetical protein
MRQSLAFALPRLELDLFGLRRIAAPIWFTGIVDGGGFRSRTGDLHHSGYLGGVFAYISRNKLTSPPSSR